MGYASMRSQGGPGPRQFDVLSMRWYAGIPAARRITEESLQLAGVTEEFAFTIVHTGILSYKMHFQLCSLQWVINHPSWRQPYYLISEKILLLMGGRDSTATRAVFVRVHAANSGASFRGRDDP